ncbi:hypothetical protein UFOVP699_234 [uncultured Caudovirales phage]|uniref:GAF domain containing protein n=1 Tax=uncultured Caudovirales phage TaxID=2100421 RepID=A0A6J5NQY5_9CAUD|nr:hypothetical protein UFOVP699_234 [uncultured Caudovirales phage]
MASLTSIAIAFITGVLGPVIVIYVKNRLEKNKPKPDIIKDALQISETINAKIEDVKDDVDADRVWIIQFHNGGHFYPTGKSIAKFSMIYETVNANTASMQSAFQNIPVSLFSRPINELLENNIIQISDYSDDSIATFGLKYIAEEYHCRSSYYFAIKTIDDKFIGVLGIDYTKEKTKLNQKTINLLSIKAASIGGALMTHLNK